MDDFKPRTTLEVIFKADSSFGYEPWFDFRSHNGFHLGFGVLSLNIWITFVRKNYR